MYKLKNPACGAGWCNVVVLTVHTRQQLIARRGCRTGVRFVSFFLHGGDRMRLCGAWCLSGRWRDRLLADSRWHTRLHFGRCRQITIPGSRAPCLTGDMTSRRLQRIKRCSRGVFEVFFEKRDTISALERTRCRESIAVMFACFGGSGAGEREQGNAMV